MPGLRTSTIWISFDLGLRGDAEGFYAWLDEHKAKECVNDLAVLSYRHEGSLIDALKKDLDKNFVADKRTRVYVIYRDNGTNKNKGVFLYGGRRTPSWAGAAPANAEEIDVEI